MDKRITIVVTIFILIAMVPMPTAAHTAEEPFKTDLIAGGGNEKSAIDVGDVLVWNDGDYLYVKYVTDGCWIILETHLHVAASLDGIPQTKKNNPIPGQFEYSDTELFDDGVTEKTYTILLPDEWKFNVELFIAAHAVVVEICNPMILYDYSDTDKTASGPVATYYEPDDPAWVPSGPAVATWVHSSWPSIFGATWISTAEYVEDPTIDSWRKFHSEVELPESGYYLTGSVFATSDNAEELWFNGEMVGFDGEVQGPFVDDYEWSTILEYAIEPVAGMNYLDFVVRNYNQAGGSPTSNPTGLIYMASFNCYQEETAWGYGDDFIGKNWATYFRYMTQGPKLWDLPTDEVGVSWTWDLVDCYIRVDLTGVGDGYDIYDGVWNAWCVDTEAFLVNPFNAFVYSSYDPFLPASACDDEQWNYINYILNHKHPDATMWEIQWAIWYFSDVDVEIPVSVHLAHVMVEDALANGADFQPSSGQIGAVLLFNPDVQLIFIEVDP